MAESAYWRRRAVSRRRFLRAAVAGAGGLTAAAMVGCGGGSAPPPRRSPSPGRPGLDHEAAPDSSRGGVLRLPGFEAFVADTLDPHQTQFGPIYSSHSAVFSKLLRYLDVQTGVIGTDLALRMPEAIGDRPLDYVIKIRPGVRFQRPSTVLRRAASREEKAIDGCELTSADVKYSFERQMNEDSPRWPFFYRAYQYATIDQVQTPDRYTVRFRTKEPIAPFLHFLADTNAFIVPAEAVDENDEINRQEAMIGSGPFIWDRLQFLHESRFVRNPAWFGWDDPDLQRPYVDGYASLFIADDASLEATFREKRLDSALQVTNPQWVLKIRDDNPDVQAVDTNFSAWLNSRFRVDLPPYSDFRVRKALHLAADRQQIIDTIWQGWGKMHGPVSPILRWALPEGELAGLPGYRQGAERGQDLQEARSLYTAAGSPDLSITFADQPSYIPAFEPQFRQHLETVLGATVETRRRDYVQLAEGLLLGTIPVTWQYDNGWIDLDDWVYPFFHSRGTKNSFHLKDPQLDRMLDAQRRLFDFEQRRALGWEIQRYLLNKVLARLDYATPTILWIAWPYYRNFRPTPFFGNSFWLANAWIDRSDPNYRERAS
ncbi:MAG: ABC transporter substrate-binding protein [Chloroflexi bacterium]|nr:ABC transporter substrate-binding protein [Chloroflexota bacterium]